jgi:hypothetical protein
MLTLSDLTMSSMTHVVDTEAAPTTPNLTIDHFQLQLSRLNEEGLTNKQLLDNNIMRHYYSTLDCLTGRLTNTATAVQAWPTEMTALSLQVALRAVSLLWRHVRLHQRSSHSLTLIYNQPTKANARRCINASYQRQSLAPR